MAASERPPGTADRKFDQTCPRCRSQLETQSHFLTCNVSLVQWNNTIEKIIQPLQGQYQTIASIIQWALIHCRDKEIPFPDEQFNTASMTTQQTYSKLVQAQSAIGWQQILKGRWATNWVDAINQIAPGQGEREMIKITTTICLTLFLMWKQRCDILHND
jgi:hypothetical protein